MAAQAVDPCEGVGDGFVGLTYSASLYAVVPALIIVSIQRLFPRNVPSYLPRMATQQQTVACALRR